MKVSLQIKGIEKHTYVLVNVIVALLAFLRTFAFMDFLTHEGLGSVSLIVTLSALLGFSQIGLINGGYRIIAECDAKKKRVVNNTVFSYFLIVITIIVFLVGIVAAFDWAKNLRLIIGAVILGISTMLSNWLSNVIIGSSHFGFSTSANLFSSICSILFLIPASNHGLNGALLVLISQPLIFVIFVLTKTHIYRPTKFSLKAGNLKYILNYGFIPFISSILFLLYAHLEKLRINALLGTEALGKLYLLFGFITLVSLVPNSLTNLFFPTCVTHHVNSNEILLRSVVRRHFVLLLVYVLLVYFFTLVFLQSAVSLVFIDHVENVSFVLLAMPGIVAKTMCDPITMKLNATVRLRPIILIESLSLGIYIMMVFFLIQESTLGLNRFIIFSNIYFFVKLALYASTQCRIFKQNSLISNVPVLKSKDNV